MWHWCVHHESDCYLILHESEVEKQLGDVLVLGPCVQGTLKELMELCGDSFMSDYNVPDDEARASWRLTHG